MKKLLEFLKNIVQKKQFIPVIAGILLVTVACWVQSRPNETVNTLLDRLNHVVYDLRYKLATRPPPEGYTPIVIADIDEKSLAQLGRWPWPRNLFAKLIDQLFENGAVIIAFDMIMSEPESNITDLVLSRLINEGEHNETLIQSINEIAPHFDHDTVLAESLSSGDTVLGFVLHNNINSPSAGLLPPPMARVPLNQATTYPIPDYPKHQGNLPLLQEASGYGGAITVQPDEDGIIRRAPLVLRNGNLLYPSLSLQAVRLFLLEDNLKINLVSQGNFTVMESFSLGKKRIPTDHQGNVLIPFMGPAQTFPYLSAIDIINGDIPEDKLEGTLVFIGTSAFGLNDLKATSIQSLYPGVEVHATIAHNLLKGQFPYAPDWQIGAQILITVLAGLALMILLPYCNVWGLVFTVTSFLSALIGFESWLWFNSGIVLSLLIPCVLVFLFSLLHFTYHLFYEAHHSKRVEALFSQYVPPSYLSKMLTTGEDFGFMGETREMTVLFADIRSFTTISESLTVNQLKQLLNDFLSEMTEVIFNYHGTIDKYVGDMIMAFWGAPLHDENHAKHALQASMAMQKRVLELQPDFKKRNLPEVNIGIGLNSGPMNVGDMGSKFRRSYTVLGDAVNLGSRCEALSKAYGVKIIIAEKTQALCPEYRVRKLDKIRVKGKKEGIVIYEPLGLDDDVDSALVSSVNQYEEALSFYYQQEWKQAETILQKLVQDPFHQHVGSLYLKRIETYRNNPPGDDWDGVYTATSKEG